MPLTPGTSPTPTALAAPLPAPSASTSSPSPSGLRPPTARVAAARARYAQDGQASMSKPQLLVALYQRLCRDLIAAETAIPLRDFETASKNLQHAQDIVLALEDALDRDSWPLAEQVGALYAFLYQQLLQANMKKDVALIAECRTIVEPLSQTWQEAALAVAAGAAPTAETLEMRSANGLHVPTSVPA